MKLVAMCALLYVLASDLNVSAFVAQSRSAASAPQHSEPIGRGKRLFAESTINGKLILKEIPAASEEENVIQSSYMTPPKKNLLSTLSEGYSWLTSEHYLAMAFLQAGVLASSADMMTQTMEAESIDFCHVAAMATVASTMSGAMNAIWLRQLEDKFPGTETSAVATKTMIHAVILASIINSAYLVGVPLFTEHLFAGDMLTMDLATILDGWSVEEFLTLTKLEVLMFIPYNTLAFKFVPPSIRPLTHATISATFNVAVSAVTLGYFSVWCERAMAMLPV